MELAALRIEPNIGPKETKQRHLLGLGLAFLTFLLLIFVLANTTHRLWRLSLLPFYLATFLCFFQAKEKTCLLLAKQGIKKFGRQIDKVAQNEELVCIRRQAVRVMHRTWIAAVITLLLTLVL